MLLSYHVLRKQTEYFQIRLDVKTLIFEEADREKKKDIILLVRVWN